MYTLLQGVSRLLFNFFLTRQQTSPPYSFFLLIALFSGCSFPIFGQSSTACGPIPLSRHYDFNIVIDSMSTPSTGVSYNLGDTIKIHFRGIFNTLSYGYLPKHMELYATAQLSGLTRIDTGQYTSNMHFARFDSVSNRDVYHLDTLAIYCSGSYIYILSDTSAFNQGSTSFTVGGQEVSLPNQSFQTKGYDVYPHYNYVQVDIKQPNNSSYLLCDCNSHLSLLCDVSMSFEDTVCGASSVPYYGASHCTYVNTGSDTVQIISYCSWNYADDWRPFLPGGIFSYHAPYRSVVNGVAHMSHAGSTLYANPGDSYSFNSQFEIHNFNVDRDLIVHFEFRFTNINDYSHVVIHHVYDTISTCALTLGAPSLKNMPVRVYPNPSSGIVNVDFEQDGVYQIYITDLTGRDILQHEYHGKHYQFNASPNKIVSGTYFIIYTDMLTGTRGQTKIILTP